MVEWTVTRKLKLINANQQNRDACWYIYGEKKSCDNKKLYYEYLNKNWNNFDMNYCLFKYFL